MGFLSKIEAAVHKGKQLSELGNKSSAPNRGADGQSADMAENLSQQNRSDESTLDNLIDVCVGNQNARQVLKSLNPDRGDKK